MATMMAVERKGSPLEAMLPKPLILVVEDEMLIRLLIADHLRGEGFIVLESSNAEEALEAFGSQAGIDLVFTDHNLSGDMDGQTLARWVEEHRPGIPVILTSGTLVGSSRGPANLRFLAKPYDVLDVERQIRELLF